MLRKLGTYTYWALALGVLGSRMKGMVVKSTTKLAIALLLAVVLFANPIGACGGITKAASAPSHPCCPKTKAPDHCAKASCVCANAEPAAMVAPEGGGFAMLPALVTNATVIREAVAFAPAPVERTSSDDHPRFLTFHQILV